MQSGSDNRRGRVRGREYLKTEIAQIFEQHFGHRDFSILSKKWKRVLYDRLADVFVTMIELEVQAALEGAKQNEAHETNRS